MSPQSTVKKVIVTGSSGTIGTALCEALIAKGYDVVPVDWKPNKWNKKINKATVLIDLRDLNNLKNLPVDADLIVHFAANARVYNLVVDPSLAKDNFMTTFNMLEFSRQNKIPRFLFSSSREVYGNCGKVQYKEDDVHVEHCESPYTATKLAGEALVQAYRRCYEINTVIVRFSNVYGRYDESDRLIPLFIRKTKNNEELTIFGKDKILDFTYIEDAVSGVLLCIEKFDSAKGNTFNIGTGNGIKIINLAEMIINMMKSRSKMKLTQNRTGEVVHYVADISLARKILGFNPKTEIEEGLQKSIAWYSKQVQIK